MKAKVRPAINASRKSCQYLPYSSPRNDHGFGASRREALEAPIVSLRLLLCFSLGSTASPAVLDLQSAWQSGRIVEA